MGKWAINVKSSVSVIFRQTFKVHFLFKISPIKPSGLNLRILFLEHIVHQYWIHVQYSTVGGNTFWFTRNVSYRVTITGQITPMNFGREVEWKDGVYCTLRESCVRVRLYSNYQKSRIRWMKVSRMSNTINQQYCRKKINSHSLVLHHHLKRFRSKMCCLRVRAWELT